MSYIILDSDSDSDIGHYIFEMRTLQHVSRVQQNTYYYAELYPILASKFLQSAASHDASKWSEEEYKPLSR